MDEHIQEKQMKVIKLIKMLLRWAEGFFFAKDEDIGQFPTATANHPPPPGQRC